MSLRIKRLILVLFILPLFAIANQSKNEDRIVLTQLADLPEDLAFDGVDLWGVNVVEGHSITRIDGLAARNARGAVPLTSFVLKTFTHILRTDGHRAKILFPTGIAASGSDLWVSMYGGVRGANNRVPSLWHLRVQGDELHEVVGFYYLPRGMQGGGPRGVAFDGYNVWVADDVYGLVGRYNVYNGRNDMGFYTNGFSWGAPTGLSFDSSRQNLVLSTYQDSSIWYLDGYGNVTDQKFSFESGPVGLAYEDGKLWVADDHVDRIERD